MLSTPGKIFSRQHRNINLIFYQKAGSDISCKLSLLKNKKNIINLSSADFAHREVNK